LVVTKIEEVVIGYDEMNTELEVVIGLMERKKKKKKK